MSPSAQRYDQQISSPVSIEAKERLNELAAERGITLSAVLREAINLYLSGEAIQIKRSTLEQLETIAHQRGVTVPTLLETVVKEYVSRVATFG